MKSSRILTVIVICQFFCTSLWFAGNGVLNDLVNTFNLDHHAIGDLTAAVQLGFILGTLSFAILTITDRFSPSKVFMVCALFGALFNLGMITSANTLWSIIAFRFLTGFCLAGIYPVGMKIAADYFEKGLGKSLGFLVGALVLGTALPHLLKDFTNFYPWKSVITTTSVLATIGGLLMAFLVPDGPYRLADQKLNLMAFFSVFRNKNFRSAAFGYFGHMWELYAFWAFVPVILTTYSSSHPDVAFSIPLLSFIIIGIGGVACAIGGYASQQFGAKRIAFSALLLSCVCCLVSPLAFTITHTWLFVAFLVFWGMVVIADSPLFSTMVAQNAIPEIKGTALTIVNCIGFSITIVSIQLLTSVIGFLDSRYLYLLLAPGPIMGLLALSKFSRQ